MGDTVANLEPEFGCEHLKDILESDSKTAGQFYESLLVVRKSQSLQPQVFRELPQSRPPYTRKISFKPLYQCLHCPVTRPRDGRAAHHEKAGHIFFADCRTGSMWCQRCCDFIYDSEVDRVLQYTNRIMQRPKKRTITEALAYADAEEASYLTSNSNKRLCGKEGVRGLFNLGQTCYMNVILQTLFHEPLLTSYFLGHGHRTYDCSEANCFGCHVAEAFAEFNNDEKEEGFGALNLLLSSWQSSPDLAGYQQQDAHEFYQFLVNKLHATAENRVDGHNQRCRCFFHKAFFGKLQSSVTCHNCGNTNRTEDPIMDLSLAFQVQRKKKALNWTSGDSDTTPTLNGCLESYTAPEDLPASDYNCSWCRTPQGATKQLRLRTLPVILCMQLKRFERHRSVSEKVDAKVAFPLSVNMAPYTTRSRSKNIFKYNYDLLSVVVHVGDIDSGHYLAYCCQGEQWFKFNDDRVTVATEADVLGADAYLLFYTLRSLSGTA
ncbi:ubiquitin carboxyl-terminal hydrolase [Emydomyces testavorans]|uniref:Ubiquitin carboxyl-terminal hydrolase n=1 Tax=Emydomyces testavorans TaxID=2070801 RepID=A0AAF0IKL5_9EURO|nr:ubiquitin carboxyl-terminal hydrolase [Emydomyces testavorans]